MIDTDFFFTNNEDFKSGYVSIVGSPNVGKSTLLNKLCGEKIAITADKPQTTRNKILAVQNLASAQIIFLDTPGIHSSEKIINQRIVETAFNAAEEADLLLYVIDATEQNMTNESLILEKLQEAQKKVILIINKVDLIQEKETILDLTKKWSEKFNFSEIIPASALSEKYENQILSAIEKHLPFGMPFYPEDFLTDMPVKFIAAEIIREKVFHLTHHEVPYSTAVTIDKFDEKKKKVEIFANINLERSSQKGIVIGKNGSMIKEIGTQARMDIEELLQKKVVLHLFVRIHKNWTKKPGCFDEYGI